MSESRKDIVENANGDSVTEGRLFEKSARIVKRLKTDPIIDYLSADEQPHYIFSGQKTGMKIMFRGEEEVVSPSSGYHAFLVVTDKRLVTLVGQEDGDEEITISYDEIRGLRIDNRGKVEAGLETESGYYVFHTNDKKNDWEDAEKYIKSKSSKDKSELETPLEWSLFELTEIDDPYKFEKLVAKAMRSKGGLKMLGMKTEVTQRYGDSGVDINIKPNFIRGIFEGDREMIVQVKHRTRGKVQVDEVERMHGVRERRGSETTDVYYVTNSEYTSGAKDAAEDLDIELINGKDLVEILNKTDISPAEWV